MQDISRHQARTSTPMHMKVMDCHYSEVFENKNLMFVEVCCVKVRVLKLKLTEAGSVMMTSEVNTNRSKKG